jgi:hypothetical protein
MAALGMSAPAFAQSASTGAHAQLTGRITSPPASTSDDYVLENDYGDFAYVPLSDGVDEASLVAVKPESWVWDGGTRDVAGQEGYESGGQCLTPAADSSGAGLIETACNGAPRQEWWLDPDTDQLINEYGSVHLGTNFFLCTNTSGVEYVRTGYYNGYCEWTLVPL